MRTANFMFYGEDDVFLAESFRDNQPVRVILGGVGFMMMIVSRRETIDTRPKEAERVFVYDLTETV